MLNKYILKNTLNQLGKQKKPFLFIIDFEVKNYYIKRLDQLDPNIYFNIENFSNIGSKKQINKNSQFKKNPISFIKYQLAFEHVIQQMRAGNTYLLNLTFPTEIEIDMPLLDIFHASQAPFKLYFKDKFISFSPERFIKIENNIIKTYPMKGTIDAKIPDAHAKILSSEKEKAEHTMVVDLLRNDLSIVAKKVKVNKFRYIETLKTNHKQLLQVSSEISGELENDWHNKIGDILLALLPAGSISGTPKRKTLEIIKTVENYNRGFFSGVFGYFDGKKLDSAIMIRFIENYSNKLIYKSGGGITIDSNAASEYAEMLDKIYIPVAF
jgi:para-aminobenzoate synthetase component 1